jgi:DNA repair protein RadC
MELLAILLGSGTQKRSVLELASDLLGYFGSLKQMAEASVAELKQVSGIGEAKAVQIKAIFALLGRMEEQPQKPLLDAPEKVYALIRGEMGLQKVETLMVVLRDVRKCCVHREIIAKGTLTELLLHPREIFHFAIKHRAHSLILAHNHPSGDHTPSLRDKEMTHVLLAASKFVGIELSDHLIIGSSAYYSFFHSGLFPRPQY